MSRYNSIPGMNAPSGFTPDNTGCAELDFLGAVGSNGANFNGGGVFENIAGVGAQFDAGFTQFDAGSDCNFLTGDLYATGNNVNGGSDPFFGLSSSDSFNINDNSNFGTSSSDFASQYTNVGAESENNTAAAQFTNGTDGSEFFDFSDFPDNSQSSDNVAEGDSAATQSADGDDGDEGGDDLDDLFGFTGDLDATDAAQPASDANGADGPHDQNSFEALFNNNDYDDIFIQTLDRNQGGFTSYLDDNVFDNVGPAGESAAGANAAVAKPSVSVEKAAAQSQPEFSIMPEEHINALVAFNQGYESANVQRTADPTSFVHSNVSYQPGAIWSVHGNAKYQPGPTPSVHGNAKYQSGPTSSVHGNAKYQPGPTPSIHGNANHESKTIIDLDSYEFTNAQNAQNAEKFINRNNNHQFNNVQHPAAMHQMAPFPQHPAMMRQMAPFPQQQVAQPPTTNRLIKAPTRPSTKATRPAPKKSSTIPTPPMSEKRRGKQPVGKQQPVVAAPPVAAVPIPSPTPSKKRGRNSVLQRMEAAKRSRTSPAPFDPAQQPRGRPVRELLALRFIDLTPMEKSRLLLPLFNGEHPLEAEAREKQFGDKFGAQRQREALEKAERLNREAEAQVEVADAEIAAFQRQLQAQQDATMAEFMAARRAAGV